MKKMKEKNYGRIIGFFVITVVFLFGFPAVSSAHTISDSDEVPGGDCVEIGNWDALSKKCTLNKDVNETIIINSDETTLDGAGFKINGSNRSGRGVFVDHRIGVVVMNVFVSNFSEGIYFSYCENGRVLQSIVENNGNGIYLGNSKNITVSNNTLKFNSYGIYHASSSGNTYQENTILDTTFTGLYITSGYNNALRNNTVRNGLSEGIWLADANYNFLSGNVMSGNRKGNFSANSLDMGTNAIDTSNTVEGKPVYYIKGAMNQTYDESMDVGSFYFVNCDNIKVQGINLPENGSQIKFWHTNNSSIEKTTSIGSNHFITLYYSSLNTITGNTFREIFLRHQSNNNTISNNNLMDKYTPVYLNDSIGNIFNLGLPIGGNYWKRYGGCHDIDFNGFCDSVYKPITGVIDNYPLAKEFTGSLPVPTGNSNVLFLPGIKASKLYKKEANGVENQLWTPNYFDNDLEQLALDEDGDSEEVVYTQDVVTEKPVTGGDIYKTFIEKLALLKSSAVINDYALFAYDWRRSVEDVAQGETLYRSETKQALVELENLAESAKNKKVTIIAHSNGGLLAKALMLELEKLGKADKVDKIIFVGTPQMGTPLSILSLLYGYNEASPLDILISQRDSRILAENMPGAYGLLPSEKYFERAGTENPFITFSSEHTRYLDFKNAYDESIFGIDEFKQFLTGTGDGRIDPDADEIDWENRLNGKLISEAFAMHKHLDAWTPPENVKVIEIAGWGLDTISGVDYAEKEDVKCYAYPGSKIPSCTGIGDYEPVYEPKFTVDGDGIVVAPSALMMEEGASVEKYWVDLWSYDDLFTVARNHASILEVIPLQQFISSIIDNTCNSSVLPENISDHRPNPQEYSNAKPRIRMSLYSPLNINLSDGIHVTGPEKTTDGQIVIREEIPNSYYYQFGERKYVGFPSGENINVTLDGYEAGDYTLKLEEVRETAEGAEILAHTTFKNLPVSLGTKVFLNISETGLASLSNLEADFDGNGEIDYAVIPVPNGEAVLPDTIAPETKLELVGASGANSWYIGDVTVELLAEDNKGGTGVSGIKYAMNDSEEHDYTGPVSISNEGINSLKYFAIDNAGNKEKAKSETIKIDKTAPEARLIFNQTEQKIDIAGVDNLSGEVTVAVEEKIIEQKEETKKGLFSRIYAIIKKANKQKQVVATLRDEAGHKTEIVLEKNEFGDHFVNLFPKSVSYDGIETEFRDALLQYKWLYDSRKEWYLLFGTHIKNGSELLEAHYFPKKNETWIMEKPRELDADENDDDIEKRSAWKKLPGLVVPYFQTKQGAINIAY